MVAKNLSDIWRNTLKVGAAEFHSVTEIAPKSPFLCVNRSLIRYGFRAGARTIRYTNSVNITLTVPHQNRLVRSQDKSSITKGQFKHINHASPTASNYVFSCSMFGRFHHLVERCLAFLDQVWKAINRFIRALTILTATVVHEIILSSPHKPLDTTRTLHFPVNEIHLPLQSQEIFSSRLQYSSHLLKHLSR